MNQDIQSHLERLKSELDKLTPAITHLQQADRVTTDVVNAAKGIHEAYSLNLKEIEEFLRAANDDHQKQITSAIKGSVDSLESTIEKFLTLHESFDKLVKWLLAKYELLATETSKLVEKIDKVDFPTRLDKLDATVSSINHGFQNMQQRIGDVERNLKDDIQAKNKETAVVIDAAKAKIEMVIKENRLLKLLLFSSLAISVTTLILLLLKV